MTYDRWFLLGEKRNELLTLREVEQYGRDNFGDPDYVSIYGLAPREWYARGVRILGRTAVEWAWTSTCGTTVTSTGSRRSAIRTRTC